MVLIIREYLCFYYRGFFDDSYWHHKNARDKNLNEISSLISAKETISPLTVELSGSVNTVHLVLANVPIKQNYNWGTSFINGFRF